jgi:hypothetical protein
MTTPRWSYKRERASVDASVDGDERASCEAMERWLDDGGALDNETTCSVRGFSPLQFVKPQGGFL